MKFTERYGGARLNSKQVCDAIKSYIEEENECTVADLYKRFISEYGWDIQREGEQKAIVEWLRGLAINCEYNYYAEAELMAKWTGDSVENQQNYIDKKGDEVYWILLGREILKGKKDAEKLPESKSANKKSIKESSEEGEIYNKWLKDLDDICSDVCADCGDKDALFFARAGYPNAFVKGKEMDRLVKDNEADDLGTAFAIIVDNYSNANFMYSLVKDDEEHHQIEICMPENAIELYKF